MSDEKPPTFDAARADISAWMRTHASDDAALREGSRLLARFVAAAVRRDRATVAMKDQLRGMAEEMEAIFRTPWRPRP